MYPTAKRALDVIIGLGAAVILSPLLLVLMVAVKLTSPGPAIHWSKRVGKNNVEFMMAKLRTMKIDTPQVATHMLQNPDQYLTPIGSFLRKSSLDELPQLINILRGDLSFVGPRPALFNQHDLIELRTTKGIHEIPPGLTGWAQVRGRDDLPIPMKVDFDHYYLIHRSLYLDIKIMLMTFLTVIQSKNIQH